MENTFKNFTTLKELQNEKKVDPFEGLPIITMHKTPTEVGKAWRFSFNKTACEVLNITENTEYILNTLFAKQDDNLIVAMVTSIGDAFSKNNITHIRKNKAVNNKIIYKEIMEALKIESQLAEEDVQLILVDDKKLTSVFEAETMPFLSAKLVEIYKIEDTIEKITDTYINSFAEIEGEYIESL